MPTPLPLFREGHALVIGVSEYSDARWNVPTAERDAAGLYETLADPALSGYPGGQVEQLTGAQVTRAGIAQALQRLAERSRPESVVVISFTSHGAPGTDNLYYLATCDTTFTGDKITGGTGIHVVELARALREIQAQQLLLIINACFSGHLGEELPKIGIAPEAIGAPLPERQADELAGAGEGRMIITASRPNQPSFYSEASRCSYFGQAVIDGMRGSGIRETSGYIGVFDLYTAVYHQVREITARRGRLQEPVLTVLRNVGPFPVARYPGATSADKAALLPHAAADTAVRVVERHQASVTGVGNTVLQTGDHSPITIQYERSLIRIGDNVQMGSFQANNVTGGDLLNVNVNTPAPQPEASEPKNPLDRLPRLEKQLSTARNVGEDDRDEAALRIRQGYRAYVDGNRDKARERLSEALRLMRAMGNGYVDSLAKKVEAAIQAL